MKRDIGLFIEDILNSIKNIEEFSKNLDKDKFSKDILRQSAIIRQLEIIGEAAKNVPNSFREKYPNIAWKDIAGVRDVLSHAYFGVNSIFIQVFFQTLFCFPLSLFFFFLFLA